MLDKKLILKLLRSLNQELERIGARGEVGLCGGAVMCLVFDARKATKDVDAVFHPTREIRKAAKAVARRYEVPEDWLNDAAKGFFRGEPPREDVLELSNVRVWAPIPEYMLAMKSVSARLDTHDGDDVRFLIEWLGLKTAKEVFAIIEKYYPRGAIPAKTQFFIEELFEGGGLKRQ